MRTNRKVFIGGAWPYANNSLHFGHLVALLPGDVIARYHRQCGDRVVYVSGSDCHGTPITLRAQKLGVTPQEIAEHYYKEACDVFGALDFTYDVYTKTYSDFHYEKVQEYIKKIGENGFLYEKDEPEDYCEHCQKFLADRDVVGTCPFCGGESTGDQCDSCYSALTPDMLKDRHCKTCGNPTTLRNNRHMYFALSKFEQQLKDFVAKYGKNWRQTAINETNKYINEGLRDRAITRQINWGIPVPFAGFEDKRLYVWIEAVFGYLTAGEQACEKLGYNFDEFVKGEDTLTYYSHGKDNVVFHTIIWPALLEALEGGYTLPKYIVSCEFMNMNNAKMSKSKGNYMTVNSLIKQFDSDTIRYYFILNNPERKDSNFSLDDFINIHNKHLVGGFGNFVNRNLAFLVKKFGGQIPHEPISKAVEDETARVYDEVRDLFERCELREAVGAIYNYIQFANRYYDENTPWVLAQEDVARFKVITSDCIFMICNIANLLRSITPKASKKIFDLLKIEDNGFDVVRCGAVDKLEGVDILFEKIDPTKVVIDPPIDTFAGEPAAAGTVPTSK